MFGIFKRSLTQNVIIALCALPAYILFRIIFNIVIGAILGISANREYIESIIMMVFISIVYLIFKIVIFKDVIEKTSYDKQISVWGFLGFDTLSSVLVAFMIYLIYLIGLKVPLNMQEIFSSAFVYLSNEFLWVTYIIKIPMIVSFVITIIFYEICCYISYIIPHKIEEKEEANKKNIDSNSSKFTKEEIAKHRDKYDGYY